MKLYCKYSSKGSPKIPREAHTCTCHKLWTEICEINQNFKGDLIKLCEIFIKITLEPHKINQKAFILM